MDSCPECGNTDLTTRAGDAGVLYECGLCGALAGDPRAVRAALDAREAVEHGVDPAVWPLCRLLAVLPGLRLGDANGGAAGRLPALRFQVLDARGLLQVENLLKSLQLAAGSLRLPWTMVVEFDRCMLFALRAAVAPGPATLAAARADLDTLQRALERDMALSWWQRPRALANP